MLLRMENDRLRKQIEELKKQASVSSCDSSAGSLEYYKNLVVQRDQEICILYILIFTLHNVSSLITAKLG